MQRGHKGCISTGMGACTGGTVKVRVRHVIDRGRKGGVHSLQDILSQSWCQKVVQLKTVIRSKGGWP